MKSLLSIDSDGILFENIFLCELYQCFIYKLQDCHSWPGLFSPAPIIYIHDNTIWSAQVHSLILWNQCTPHTTISIQNLHNKNSQKTNNRIETGGHWSLSTEERLARILSHFLCSGLLILKQPKSYWVLMKTQFGI